MVEKAEKEEENIYSGGRSVSWFLCQNLDELFSYWAFHVFKNFLLVLQ